MQNIWNNVLFVGPSKQNAIQRRNFGYEQPIVRNITAEKSFNNPNFVNKDHPRIHNYHRNNYSMTPSATVVDNQNNEKTFTNDTVYKNSSQSILETLKENFLNAKEPVDHTGIDIPHPLNVIMCNENARKNWHRSRKDQSHNKKHGRLNKEIEEMMDIDTEAQNYTNVDNVIMGLKEHHPPTLLDVLCNNSIEKEDAYFSETDEEDVESDQEFIISSSPSTIGNKLNRERTISATESEDSFIVFEDETDDELDFTDNSQEEDESDEDDESEVTDEVDSTASSVVPRKKVNIFKHFGKLFL